MHLLDMKCLIVFVAVCSCTNSVKTGRCPDVKPGAAEICLDLCSVDESCDDDLKCCSNGCGKTCQFSVDAQPPGPPLTTPANHLIETELPENATVKDHQDVDLSIRKPGLCPPPRLSLHSGMAVACFNQCKTDGDCESALKCCYNGCAFMCESISNTTSFSTPTFEAPTIQPSAPADVPLFHPFLPAEEVPLVVGVKGMISEPVVMSPSVCPSGEQPLFYNGTPIACGLNIGTCPPAYFCLFENSHQKLAVCCPKPPCPIPKGVPGCDWVVGLAGTDGCPQYTQRCGMPIEKLGRDKIQVDSGAKSGRCPPVPPGRVGMCVSECYSDKNCSDTKKCCTNGCGLVCQVPLPVCPQRIQPKLPAANCHYEEEEFDDDGCMRPIKFRCSNETEDDVPTPESLFVQTTARPISLKVLQMKPKIVQNQSENVICDLDPDSGPCKSFSEKWYFDSRLQSCQMFIHGGCMGNGNHFSNKNECEKICGKRKGSTVSEKRGFCPPYFANSSHPGASTIDTCSSDDDCLDSTKCCRNERGYNCLRSEITAKPGSCPSPGLLTAETLTCINICQNDFDCPDFRKCCNTMCSKVCANPVSEKPCDKIKCPACHQCVEKLDGSAFCVKSKADCCPDGSSPVACISNPCQFSKCPKFPNARCVVDLCGSCRATFFDLEGKQLQCG